MSVIPHSYMAIVIWNWKVTLLFIWGMYLQGTQGILLAQFFFFMLPDGPERHLISQPLSIMWVTEGKCDWISAASRKKNWVGVWLRILLLFFLYSSIHSWSLLSYPHHHKSSQNSLHWTFSVMRLGEASGGKELCICSFITGEVTVPICQTLFSQEAGESVDL